MNRKQPTFDFDAWMRLAEQDPEAFERRRAELLQAEIELAPADIQPRLRGLQWQIDMTRRRYKHPAAASAKLFEMMWNQVYGERGFLEALTTVPARRDAATGAPREATVLPWRGRAARSGS